MDCLFFFILFYYYYYIFGTYFTLIHHLERTTAINLMCHPVQNKFNLRANSETSLSKLQPSLSKTFVKSWGQFVSRQLASLCANECRGISQAIWMETHTDDSRQKLRRMGLLCSDKGQTGKVSDDRTTCVYHLYTSVSGCVCVCVWWRGDKGRAWRGETIPREVLQCY